MSQTHLIKNQWIAGSGPVFQSINPATGETLWQGAAATENEVNQAVEAARKASESWADTPWEKRLSLVEGFKQQLEAHRSELADCISAETGKARWETDTEVGAMINKIPISAAAYEDRTGERQKEMAGFTAVTRHKPHGVVAVFGPYNFPGHLPNGHIVPALLAGNTVVFKPSELTPWVAQKTLECWLEAGLPEGVINLVQGERDTGKALAAHPEIDGLFFTGSVAVGQLLHKQFADQPHKILALELGGNNPLIIWDSPDVDAAAYHTIQSAYLSSGQRCTCARRLILPEGSEGDVFLERLTALIHNIRVAAPTDSPEPFMGPVISSKVVEQLLTRQAELTEQGGKPLVAMKSMDLGPSFVSPGLMDVTAISKLPDQEIFGPFLTVFRVPTFEDAIQIANRTSYGLSAGLFSDKLERYQVFYRRIRAGIVNWNRPLTGASSNAPFGGVGDSGNHRPSAYYAADYCAYPVASLEADRLQVPEKLPPGLSL